MTLMGDLSGNTVLPMGDKDMERIHRDHIKRRLLVLLID